MKGKMVKLTNDICTVEISIDEDFDLHSDDKGIYVPDEYKETELYKAVVVSVVLPEQKYNAVMVGSIYFKDANCAVLEKQKLLILQDDRIIRFNVVEKRVEQIVELDTFGNNFAIYRVPKRYIIYGEIEITMLDDSFQKKWIFSGNDVFVSLTQEKSFEIKDGIIYVYDFDDRLYQLNFEGKEINRLV